VDGVAANSSPGGFLSTGRSLDVAIHGDGMFAVSTARGVRYTRLGSLQVATDGRLVTREGDLFLNRDSKPIRVPPGVTDVSVGSDGVVQSGNEIFGQLALVNFKNPAGLGREGALIYRATPASGPPGLSTATIEPNMLEQSNVSVVKGMVDIVGASRGFEACERAIDAFKDADRRAAMALMGKD
jgi:flagellar basal body rod protein FlgG